MTISTLNWDGVATSNIRTINKAIDFAFKNAEFPNHVDAEIPIGIFKVKVEATFSPIYIQSIEDGDNFLVLYIPIVSGSAGLKGGDSIDLAGLNFVLVIELHRIESGFDANGDGTVTFTIDLSDDQWIKKFELIGLEGLDPDEQSAIETGILYAIREATSEPLNIATVDVSSLGSSSSYIIPHEVRYTLNHNAADPDASCFGVLTYHRDGTVPAIGMDKSLITNDDCVGFLLSDRIIIADAMPDILSKYLGTSISNFKSSASSGHWHLNLANDFDAVVTGYDVNFSAMDAYIDNDRLYLSLSLGIEKLRRIILVDADVSVAVQLAEAEGNTQEITFQIYGLDDIEFEIDKPWWTILPPTHGAVKIIVNQVVDAIVSNIVEKVIEQLFTIDENGEMILSKSITWNHADYLRFNRFDLPTPVQFDCSVSLAGNLP